MTLLRRLALGVVASALLHGALLLVLTRLSPAEPPRVRDEVVDFELVETEPEPVLEEPPPEPAPPPPEPPPPQAPAKKAPPPKAPPPAEPDPVPPPKTEAPPPSNAPPPEDAPKKKAPLVTGLSMSSVVKKGEGSGMQVGVGNTMYGTPDREARDPEAVQPYRGADRYVPPHRVTQLPRVAREVRAPYPPEARARGIEGRVRLRLRIDAAGKVAEVSVLEGAGHGLDEAAVKALRQFRFEPAAVDGEAVATTLDYTYTFVLD